MKRIYSWEPWFFIFFGIFHLHRIWALIDRTSYASFWLGIMGNKGVAYFLIMGALAVLCILGIITFIRECKSNYWWRWIYVFGGMYLLFDLFAIAVGLEVWNRLILLMFDTNSKYWNIIWGFFIILGGVVFVLGIKLFDKNKFVYKNEECMKKMYDFYDRTLASLNVPYSESYFDTSFGKTHCLLVGDKDKPRICTIHGGNGITTLNLKLFLPLLSEYSIIAPDVIGMPGKSEPYRNIRKNDDYGLWIKEVLDHYNIDKISFVVSSYSTAMFLSFAKLFPKMADKSLLLVPSGIAHGAILPMLGKMVVPFIKYYFNPSEKTLDAVIETMGGNGDTIWREFFDLMMSSYKMEMKPPKEYCKKEMAAFKAPLLIIVSPNDIFFPANKVFSKARKIFDCPVTTAEIDSKHLPSDEVMIDVCKRAKEFFLK